MEVIVAYCQLEAATVGGGSAHSFLTSEGDLVTYAPPPSCPVSQAQRTYSEGTEGPSVPATDSRHANDMCPVRPKWSMMRYRGAQRHQQVNNELGLYCIGILWGAVRRNDNLVVVLLREWPLFPSGFQFRIIEVIIAVKHLQTRILVPSNVPLNLYLRSRPV